MIVHETFIQLYSIISAFNNTNLSYYLEDILLPTLTYLFDFYIENAINYFKKNLNDFE